MIGFGRARTTGLLAAMALAVSVAAPMVFAPNASALAAPTIAVALTGSVTGSADVIGTGCPATITATLKQPDGSPVPQGTVEFFDVGPGAAKLVLGSAAVSRGVASVSWTPAASGQNIISAGYFDTRLQFLPIAGSAMVTVTPGINLGGFCL